MGQFYQHNNKYSFIRYIRKDTLALGKISLNLTSIPLSSDVAENYPRTLYCLLERLVTKAHYLPMSLENLNTLRMIPKKDYQENRLIAGCLQLSPQTHLVLDETAMSEGIDVLRLPVGMKLK